MDAVSLSTTNGDEVTRTGGDKNTGGIEQHCVGDVHGVPVSPYDADDARETGDDGSIAEGGDEILHGKLEVWCELSNRSLAFAPYLRRKQEPGRILIHYNRGKTTVYVAKRHVHIISLCSGESRQ